MRAAVGRSLWLIPVLLAGAVLYFLVDPGESALMPKCLFKTLTGLDCPGCGSQRALHSLLHGHLGEALRMNALLVVMLPLIGWMVWLECVRKKRPKLYASFYRPWVIWTFGGIIGAWFVMRNLLPL